MLIFFLEVCLSTENWP